MDRGFLGRQVGWILFRLERYQLRSLVQLILGLRIDEAADLLSPRMIVRKLLSESQAKRLALLLLPNCRSVALDCLRSFRRSGQILGRFFTLGGLGGISFAKVVLRHGIYLPLLGRVITGPDGKFDYMAKETLAVTFEDHQKADEAAAKLRSLGIELFEMRVIPKSSSSNVAFAEMRDELEGLTAGPGVSMSKGMRKGALMGSLIFGGFGLVLGVIFGLIWSAVDSSNRGSAWRLRSGPGLRRKKGRWLRS